ERPARQVWVGFDSQSWPRSKDFVVFWTNVLDWLGEGGSGYSWQTPAQLGPEWARDPTMPAIALEPAPGVYRRSDGAVRALNVSDVRLNPAPRIDWRAKLHSLQSHQAGTDLRPSTLLAAILLAGGAMLAWKRRNMPAMA